MVMMMMIIIIIYEIKIFNKLIYKLVKNKYSLKKKIKNLFQFDSNTIFYIFFIVYLKLL